MELELRSHQVNRIAFGADLELQGGLLSIDRTGLRDFLGRDSRLTTVDVDIAHPGESVRIVHVLDAVEPRAKTAPPGPAFPGHTGPPLTTGAGSTVRLAGAAVIVAGLPEGAEDPAFWQESIIDMAGAGARYGPLSATANVVLTISTSPGLSPDESRQVMRLAGMRAAEYLAAAPARDPDVRTERLALAPPARRLPRVALLVHLESWGTKTSQRTFLYGLPVDGLLPTLLHPNEVLDGALTAGSSHLPAIRNGTYFFQNHALVRALMGRHGTDLHLVGVVVSRSLWESYDDKRRAAAFTANLLQQLEVTGAVLTFAHGGHAVTDVALTAEACRGAGIRLTTLMFEMAGVDGFDFGLVQLAPEAEPFVSLGNYQAVLSLPPVDRALGGTDIRGVSGDATSRRPAREALALPVGYLFAASEPSGGGRLTARLG